MSFALFIPVKQTLVELRKQFKKATPMLQPRIKMLILMKEAWRRRYLKAEFDGAGRCLQSEHP